MGNVISGHCVGYSGMGMRPRRMSGGETVVLMLLIDHWGQEEGGQDYQEDARLIRSMSYVEPLQVWRSSDDQLHRHTARYPTTDGGRRLLSALGKLRDREVNVPRRHPEYAFLEKADFDLKDWTFDGLMDQGRKA